MKSFPIKKFIFSLIITLSTVQYAEASNCKITNFKSVEDLISVVIDSGFNEINLIKSGTYSASELSVYYKQQNGQLGHVVFDPEHADNNDLWVRVPEFDYNDSPPSVNLSCGYGNINYKMAYKVGNSALCFLHNPKGSVIGHRGRLESCIIIPYDINTVLNKVKQIHRNMFELNK